MKCREKREEIERKEREEYEKLKNESGLKGK